MNFVTVAFAVLGAAAIASAAVTGTIVAKLRRKAPAFIVLQMLLAAAVAAVSLAAATSASRAWAVYALAALFGGTSCVFLVMGRLGKR